MLTKSNKMLRYTEIILEKVSFNKELFKAELRKSLSWLKKEEVSILRAWCVIKFGKTHGDIIRDIFRR